MINVCQSELHGKREWTTFFTALVIYLYLGFSQLGVIILCLFCIQRTTCLTDYSYEYCF